MKETSKNTHSLQSFEGRKHKQSINGFWRKLMVVLEIDGFVELEALRILWKLAKRDIRVTKALLFK